MGMLQRKKQKRSRTKKTLKEKTDALADKKLFELIRDNPDILLAYINKREGLNIPPESERKLNRIVEETKLAIYEKVADDLPRDPEVAEAVRDKLISELGLPINPRKGYGDGGRPPRPNFQGRLENMMRIVDQADEIKKRLGVNDSGWSKILENPEVVKVILALAQSLFGLPQQNNPAENSQPIIKVQVNGEWVDMKYEDYLIFKQQRERELLKANPTLPSQGNQGGKSPGVGDNTSSSPPSPAPSNTTPEPASIPADAGDVFRVYIDKIIAAMDSPAEEFVQKTIDSIKSGDKESMQIRDFLLANGYDSLLKQISGYKDCVKKFKEHRNWYDQAVVGFRAQG
jgi:hypothetical protein